MDFKQSFERIVKWAKEHPYIAAALIIGVVILAWLTVKNRKDSGGDAFGGGGGELPTIEPTEPGGFGAGLGGDEGFGSLAPLPENAPAVPAQQFEQVPASMGGGDFSPVDFSGFGSYASGAPVVSPSAESLASQPSASQPTSKRDEVSNAISKNAGEASRINAKKDGSLQDAGNKTVQGGSKLTSGIVTAVSGATANPSGIVSSVSGAGSSRIVSAIKKPTTKKAPNNPTPAYRAGLPLYFSGRHNGIIYVAGYPVMGQGTQSAGKGLGSNTNKGLGSGR